MALSVVFFVGCGGGSSEGLSAQIKSKNYVLILKNAPSGVCETSEFKDALVLEGLRDVVTSEELNSVSCATYGKTFGADCEVEYYTGRDRDNVACVVGFNDFVAMSSKREKQINETDTSDTVDTVMIQIAE